ncbi:unnamed protein product [Sphacelaria rigidula]
MKCGVDSRKSRKKSKGSKPWDYFLYELAFSFVTSDPSYIEMILTHAEKHPSICRGFSKIFRSCDSPQKLKSIVPILGCYFGLQNTAPLVGSACESGILTSVSRVALDYMVRKIATTK